MKRLYVIVRGFVETWCTASLQPEHTATPKQTQPYTSDKKNGEWINKKHGLRPCFLLLIHKISFHVSFHQSHAETIESVVGVLWADASRAVLEIQQKRIVAAFVR